MDWVNFAKQQILRLFGMAEQDRTGRTLSREQELEAIRRDLLAAELHLLVSLTFIVEPNPCGLRDPILTEFSQETFRPPQRRPKYRVTLELRPPFGKFLARRVFELQDLLEKMKLRLPMKYDNTRDVW